MPDGYQLGDAHFIILNTNNSAVNGLVVASDPPVPQGKVWNILQAYAYSSIAETQNYWFSIYRHGRPFPVTAPASAVVDPATDKFYPCLREGLELRLYPGDTLRAYRDDHAVGSTLYIVLSYIETDLPLYTYDEPQVVYRQTKAISSFRSQLGGGAGRGSGPGVSPARPGGGRTGPAMP